MNKKNRDHVAVPIERETAFWAFILPSSAETCDEQANEMVSHCETLFGTFQEFLVPTEISYHIHRFPPEQTLPVGVSDDEHLEAINRKLRNESGISVEAFRDSVYVSKPGSRWIPRIIFDDVKVKIRLDNNHVYASRNEYTIGYQSGESVDNKQTQPPLNCKLLHVPNTSYTEIDTEYVTGIHISPISDIWFENTEIGSVNRRYLSLFLKRVEETFPVASIERTSDWIPLSKLEKVD